MFRKRWIFAAVCLVVFVTISLTPTFAQDHKGFLRKLEKVNLLTSGKEEILKLFGKPIGSQREFIWTYRLADGQIRVYFEQGECSWQQESQEWVGWKVPKWRVVRISYHFHDQINFEKLNLPLKGFIKHRAEDSDRGIEYVNEDTGTRYIVFSGWLENAIFLPGKKFDSMKCDGGAKKT